MTCLSFTWLRVLPSSNNNLWQRSDIPCHCISLRSCDVVWFGAVPTFFGAVPLAKVASTPELAWLACHLQSFYLQPYHVHNPTSYNSMVVLPESAPPVIIRSPFSNVLVPGQNILWPVLPTNKSERSSLSGLYDCTWPPRSGKSPAQRQTA